MVRPLIGASLIFLLAGCAAPVDPTIPINHPASPSAQEAPPPPPSTTLRGDDFNAQPEHDDNAMDGMGHMKNMDAPEPRQ